MKPLLLLLTVLATATVVWGAPPPPSPFPIEAANGQTVWLVGTEACRFADLWWMTAAVWDYQQGEVADSAESAAAMQTITCKGGYFAADKAHTTCAFRVSGRRPRYFSWGGQGGASCHPRTN